MEETRRKWKWERMHEHHFTFWTSALKCAVGEAIVNFQPNVRSLCIMVKEAFVSVMTM